MQCQWNATNQNCETRHWSKLAEASQHDWCWSNEYADWKLDVDAGEYAQERSDIGGSQWKTNIKYPLHGVAIRLIVLAQLSSCSVERVFSVLERIRQVTGEHVKEDMMVMEIRLMLQCNGDLDKLYNDLVLNWQG